MADVVDVTKAIFAFIMVDTCLYYIFMLFMWITVYNITYNMGVDTCYICYKLYIMLYIFIIYYVYVDHGGCGCGLI